MRRRRSGARRPACETSLTISMKSLGEVGGARYFTYVLLQLKAQDVLLSSKEIQLEVITFPTTSCIILITAVRGERHHLHKNRVRNVTTRGTDVWVIQSEHRTSKSVQTSLRGPEMVSAWPWPSTVPGVLDDVKGSSWGFMRPWGEPMRRF